MKDIWVISDTHLNHENMLNFTYTEDGDKVRPEFENVSQMNECILENWNSNIKQGDIVYHLGDVFMGDKDEFKTLWPILLI